MSDNGDDFDDDDRDDLEADHPDLEAELREQQLPEPLRAMRRRLVLRGWTPKAPSEPPADPHDG
jgi:hypothetical protein